MPLPAILQALRPHQWSKNVFVLAALVFASGDQVSGRIFATEDLIRTLIAFAAFCMASSAVYLFNDIVDVESDRAHPEKCKRPIASGRVSVPVALSMSIALALSAPLIGWFVVGGRPYTVGLVLILYMAMNLSYALKLKHVVLLDAFCIAAGFVMRVHAGGLAAQAEVSHWLFLCTLFLALFLALNKRRAEIMLLGEKRGAHRENLREYTPEFLDQMVGVLAACTIVCYTMYTVDPSTAQKFGGAAARLYWTVPFVVFGIGRYMLLVSSGTAGGSPTRVFLGSDPLFLANLVGWAGATAFVLFQ